MTCQPWLALADGSIAELEAAVAAATKEATAKLAEARRLDGEALRLRDQADRAAAAGTDDVAGEARGKQVQVAEEAVKAREGEAAAKSRATAAKLELVKLLQVGGWVNWLVPHHHHHHHHHHLHTSSSGRPVGCMSILLKQYLNTQAQVGWFTGVEWQRSRKYTCI